MQNSDIFCILDLQKHKGQVTRDAKRPERGLRRGPGDDLRRGGAQSRIIAHDHAAQRLEIGGVGMGDAKMAQLHLCLRPGQSGGAGKGRGVAVPVDQIKQRVRRGGNHGPERDAGHAARWNADAAADGKDRVKDCADGAGQGLVDHHGRCQVAPPPDELRPVGFNLDRAGFRPFDHRDMGGPDFGVVW